MVVLLLSYRRAFLRFLCSLKNSCAKIKFEVVLADGMESLDLVINELATALNSTDPKVRRAVARAMSFDIEIDLLVLIYYPLAGFVDLKWHFHSTPTGELRHPFSGVWWYRGLWAGRSWAATGCVFYHCGAFDTVHQVCKIEVNMLRDISITILSCCPQDKDCETRIAIMLTGSNENELFIISYDISIQKSKSTDAQVFEGRRLLGTEILPNSTRMNRQRSPCNERYGVVIRMRLNMFASIINHNAESMRQEAKPANNAHADAR
ncbi:uncharacterized protein MYCFIDRAFT_171635 [Pseudocercospora fijiensis CIRAD86]|uniref:Uncharacterized protein n=1 Tax=Pseudocercospora fijiensis (strain CIRAD86) TaxID=383855 RepID=M3A3U7_PSEFD|nr:uncharacterized protein MYCFIDRAFT_171635 [Pseudocercospora fijiensis CIRAD86]EME85759.1 hypothetical protein MYCFIDRAFT_171635 [Pseudocercospora fijiensis CIRAD86]